MSAIPLEMVHGKHLAKQTTSSVWHNDHTWFSLDEAIRKATFPVENIALISVLEQPVYAISGSAETIYLNAQSGNVVAPLDKQQVNTLAQLYYLHDHPVKSIQKLQEPPQEASRVKGASWQVIFDDWLDTTLYLHPNTGKLEHVRSDLWRLFDFVWMLHIMDYDEREDFNNPLLISFAIAALLFVLSGLVLLIKSFKPKSRRRSFA